MYLDHFGIKELPFSITPDTGFFFQHGTHQAALNVLLVALRSGEGFIKITGEVGTGKTLLARMALNILDRENFVTAYIPNPFLTPTALRMALAEELGITFARNIGQHRLLKLITDRLIQLNAAGQRVILILDEAQALPDECLETIRLLTNLETEKHKLLQVTLFGQPELDQRLQQEHLRQLRQRITFAYRLQPIERAALEQYIQHRLATAGYQGARLFQGDAIDLLHCASRGIPRLINILSHKAMMCAFGRGDTSIRAQHIRLASEDTEDVHSPARLPRYLRPAAIASLFAGVFTSAFTLYHLWMGAL